MTQKKEVEKTDKLLDEVKSKEEKIKIFSEILDDLTSTEDKKKLLWKETSKDHVFLKMK